MKSVILNYAIERKGSNLKIYKYDFLESLNVISIPGNKSIAFIDSTKQDLELLTKTRAERESDDDTFCSQLELQTKTEVSRESEDALVSLLELTTKTFTNSERDDESLNYN